MKNPVILQEGLVIDIANIYRIRIVEVVVHDSIDPKNILYPPEMIKIFNTTKVKQACQQQSDKVNIKLKLKEVQHGPEFKSKQSKLTSMQALLRSGAGINLNNNLANSQLQKIIGTTVIGEQVQTNPQTITNVKGQQSNNPQIATNKLGEVQSNQSQRILDQIEAFKKQKSKLEWKFEDNLKKLEGDVIKRRQQAYLKAIVYLQDSNEKIIDQFEFTHSNVNLQRTFALGRDKANDVYCLKSAQVSGKHGRIVYDPHYGWLYYDGSEVRSSSNGSFVNLSDFDILQENSRLAGKPEKKLFSVSHRIRDGDIIFIKGYCIEARWI